MILVIVPAGPVLGLGGAVLAAHLGDGRLGSAELVGDLLHFGPGREVASKGVG